MRNKIFDWAPKNHEEDYVPRARFGFVDHIALCLHACSISYKKWVKRGKCLFKAHLTYMHGLHHPIPMLQMIYYLHMRWVATRCNTNIGKFIDVEIENAEDMQLIASSSVVKCTRYVGGIWLLYQSHNFFFAWCVVRWRSKNNHKDTVRYWTTSLYFY